MSRIACFGGVYSNYLALEAAIADARRRGADELFFLGDAGAFGPHPDRSLAALREYGVVCLQGNYDNSIGHEMPDCQCGYTDARDNYFAQISYEYTLANTSADFREWMRAWPTEIRREFTGEGATTRVLMCHGSPRKTNEFLWETTTPRHFLEYLADEHQADLILATHTGIKWQRGLSRGRRFVNVGVLGRPENDGLKNVWYTLIEFEGPDPKPSASPPGDSAPCAPSNGVIQRDEAYVHANMGKAPRIEFIPIAYDHKRLAREMAAEGLPMEFQQTILTGWWTTCLEVLPGKERRRGIF